MDVLRVLHSPKPLARPSCRYPDAESSVGLLEYDLPVDDQRHCWKAIGKARADFRLIEPQIEKLLEEHDKVSKEQHRVIGSIPVQSLFQFSVYMIGNTKCTANPYIIFSCKDQATRQKAVQVVRKSKILDDFPGFLLGDTSHPPNRILELESLVQPVLMAHDEDVAVVDNLEIQLRRYVYSTTLQRGCGVPVTLQVLPGAKEGLRRSTLGGYVLVGGELYALTVAHAFLESLDAGTSTDNEPFEANLDDQDSFEEDDDYLVEMTSRGKV